jgi:2-methylcitrate dehydratase PrpD
MNENTISKQLAGFISEIKYEDLPKDVVEEVKWRIIDWSGCALAGSISEVGRIAVKFAEEVSGKSLSTVVGYHTRLSPASAAFINGMVSHSIEMDDVDRASLAHPGVVIIPTAISLAEALGLGGKELISAVAVGYEVMSRVGQALMPEAYRCGWHSTGVCGVIGAAAAAAKILNLSIDNIASAIGHAGTLATGLQQYAHDGAMSKCLHVGHAASMGINAACLARDGLLGASRIFEGTSGVCRMFAPERFSKEDEIPSLVYHYILKDLPGNSNTQDWRITQTSSKPYACVRPFHSAVQELLRIIKENKLVPEDIDQIYVKTNVIPSKYFSGDYVPSGYAAMLNIKYSLSIAVVKGAAGHKEFCDEVLHNPTVHDVARRVKVSDDPTLSNLLPKTLTSCVIDVIQTSSGQKFHGHPEYAHGDPEDPMTPKELEDKFYILASDVLPREKAKSLLMELKHLHEKKNVKHLTSFLCGSRYGHS